MRIKTNWFENRIIERRLIISLTVIYFSFFVSGFVQAEKIIMAVPDSGYPPYVIVEKRKISGVMVEVLRSAARKHSQSIQFSFMPENRSLVSIKNHSIHVRIESPTWVEKPESYLWSSPVISIRDHFVFNRESRKEYETDNQLKGAEVITHLGYVYPTLQQQFDAGVIKRHDYSSEKSMLFSLLRLNGKTNRVAVMDKRAALWLIKRSPLLDNQLRFSKRVVDDVPLYFQFAKTKKLKKLVPKFNAHIEHLRKSGKLDAIIKSY